MANLGTQNNWYNGEPAPIQGDIGSFNFGSQDRWYNSKPSPIQVNAATSNLTISVSDTTTITDASTLSLGTSPTLTPLVSDTTAITDAITLYQTSYKISLSDTTAVTDATTMAVIDYLTPLSINPGLVQGLRIT